MSTDRKSIAQIKKEFAEAKEGSLEELFAQYAMDERSGVKAVLNSYRKKQEKLAMVKKCSGFRKQIVMNCTYSGHEFRLL